MKRSVTTLLLLFVIIFSQAQEKLSYFLPDDVTYNPSIPTPEAFFGQEVGEWHLTHDQVLYYIKEIAKSTDRAILYEYARSWENRPLVHLVFTSEKNQEKLDELKQLHYDFSEPGKDISIENVPLVVSLTYGVHGNESSATNSSVLTAYYLAAAEGKKIDELLENTIVIVDPCLNPDGFTRHSTWANMHQSYATNGDNNSRQFDEVWPGGRTNHYWFDINRDYLLLVHPETKGRVEKFHEWKPNIVTDHHEMGANSTFFFQPGVPTRNNPLTPERNYELTHEIASYHAKFLDEIGSTYFSEEQYDDYYYGKGSSYPDVNASIGILFEQGGFRGRVRQTENGVKKLAFGIKNQFTVSLSTLEAAMNMHDKLLTMQKEFYSTAFDIADNTSTKAYVFGSEKDQVKTQMFVEFLNRHQIDVYENTGEITADATTFKAGTSFIVPLKQKQVRLIESIFEDITTFTDTTFYDVSTWSFPHAYDITCAKLTSLKNTNTGDEPVKADYPDGKVIGGKSGIGYLFRWDEFTAPKALYKLQHTGLITKVATEKFSFELNGTTEDFSFGTIFIPASGQNIAPESVFSLIEKTAKISGIDFYAVTTGLSPNGIDMGSGSFASLTKPNILMFVGGSANSADAGSIWHMFDQRYQIPVTLSESDRIGRINLSQYNTIILTGAFKEWNSTDIEKLKTWVKEGGTLVAYKSATTWAAQNKFGSTTFKKPVSPDTTRYLTYAERSKERSLNYISGAIFETEIDNSHPLCYGYTDKKLAIFKSSISVANSLDKKYTEPVKFTSTPYLSGWVSEDNIDRLKNAPVVSVQSIGRGKLISYHDNMTFRGTWLGTNKLFSNSVFFGSVIR
ncbi:M14 family zinc carboxypeptidase [Draconibacterium sp. IB214405]|uniref:M14 family zinc carboxypeptidase n=1 Tax=Draconibacterium sp. IB214405 TaxID=3097352 RepID=UPI002A0DE6A5|nr:M14 family zinc carboxypeptidase [Draconibacterium sp. IB214405]MDX8338816.1 M14 family zinc carboxypeptidase [Draconibacterium sp. IB214405]